jgi:hypothetical protein
MELLRGLGVANADARHIDDLPPALTTKFWMSVRVPNIEAVNRLADDLILKGLNGAIGSKKVTYDFARLMEGATEIKCSAFGDNLIAHM